MGDPSRYPAKIKMDYGKKIDTRPDLTLLFGQMSREDHASILDHLIKIDDELFYLAQKASEHIGVSYEHIGLKFYGGENYPEISGGPSGNAGEILFEIECSYDKTGRKFAPPWSIESRIIVFCADLAPTVDPISRLIFRFFKKNFR